VHFFGLFFYGFSKGRFKGVKEVKEGRVVKGSRIRERTGVVKRQEVKARAFKKETPLPLKTWVFTRTVLHIERNHKTVTHYATGHKVN